MSLKSILIVSLFLFAAGCATNQTGQMWKYKLSDIMVEEQAQNGETLYSVNGDTLEYFINRIAENAKEYPPKFSSEAEKEEVTEKLSHLISILEIVSSSQRENPVFLYPAALANSMGHNLDLKGAADRAKNYFDQLLKITPEDPEANYKYGMFLSGTSAYHFEGIPYLEKALAKGQKEALYTLGLLAVEQGEQEKGVRYLSEYSENNPDNSYVKKVIKAVEEGRLQFESN